MEKLFGWLSGYKTIIGTIGAVATFVLVVCNALLDGVQYADLQTIIGAFSALMIAIGLGHKAAKIESIIKK